MLELELRARDEVLVNANGTIHLAAASKQVAQGEMRLDRLGLDFEDLEKHLDRLVGPVVEQVVEAAEVIRRHAGAVRLGARARVPASDVPAG